MEKANSETRQKLCISKFLVRIPRSKSYQDSFPNFIQHLYFLFKAQVNLFKKNYTIEILKMLAIIRRRNFCLKCT